MKERLLSFVVCPECKSDFSLEGKVYESAEVKEGSLLCKSCARTYPIKNFIPRFVGGDSYVDNFSFEWQVHRTTQLDSVNGTKQSEESFKSSTGWNPEDLKGKLTLDVGCGTGRYSEIALNYGAELIMMDLSFAVDSAFLNMGLKEMVHLIQADVFHLPFKPEQFDVIFSIGVLHHTPDPPGAFSCLPPLLKKNGKIAIWVYDKYFVERMSIMSQLYRKITRKLPRRWLYALSYFAVPYYYLALIPWLGLFFRALVPISVHPNWRWRVLDTFDWYSPSYTWGFSAGEVFEWFEMMGLKNIKVLKYPPVSVRGEKV
ncbi:MAG: methyltransferase domain-containing protein [Candidatus Brocadiales bacterium]